MQANNDLQGDGNIIIIIVHTNLHERGTSYEAKISTVSL